MKIQFDTVFNSVFLCQPIYSTKGKLVSVELICRFSSMGNKLTMPTELVLNLLNTRQLTEFLTEQITWAKAHCEWFFENLITLNINIEEKLADILSQNIILCEKVKALTFIKISINESFPQLAEGKHNVRLMMLKSHFTLWLEGMGAGHTNMASVFDKVFDGIKLDKTFLWQLYEGENFSILLPSLLHNLHRFCHNIVIDGVDTPEYFSVLHQHDIQGVKGLLWPGVDPKLLDTLLKVPEEFN